MSPDKKEGPTNGFWVRCSGCNEIIYNGELNRNLRLCPKCNYCFPMDPADRIAILADEGSLLKYDADELSSFRSDGEDYERAIVTGEAALVGHRMVVAAFNLSFTGKNIRLFVCESIIRAINRAADQHLPLLMICTGDNGAHSKDSALFPAQTLSISAAMSALNRGKLLHVSVLACPCSHSLFPGFVCVADIVIAESNVPVAVPMASGAGNGANQNATAQAAQSLLLNGTADMIVPRNELRPTLGDILSFFC